MPQAHHPLPPLHQSIADQIEGLTDQLLALAKATEDNAIDHDQPIPAKLAQSWQLRLDAASQALQNATHRQVARDQGWSLSMSQSELV